jgi:hypothetical protein
LQYTVYLRRDEAIAGIGDIEDTLALLDRFSDRSPVVLEADPVVQEKWKKDKAEASEIVADRLIAIYEAKRVKETDEPFPHLKTTVSRVVYLLAKYPELRNPKGKDGRFTREPQMAFYKAMFPGSQGDTARRAFAYVQNTLGMYPPDEEGRMWQVWTEAQFREFFAAKNAEQFRGYAERAARMASAGLSALIEQELRSDLGSVDVSVNEAGLATVTKKRYLSAEEFSRINRKLRRFGIRYDRDAHVWFGGIGQRPTAQLVAPV